MADDIYTETDATMAPLPAARQAVYEGSVLATVYKELHLFFGKLHRADAFEKKVTEAARSPAAWLLLREELNPAKEPAATPEPPPPLGLKRYVAVRDEDSLREVEPWRLAWFGTIGGAEIAAHRLNSGQISRAALAWENQENGRKHDHLTAAVLDTAATGP